MPRAICKFLVFFHVFVNGCLVPFVVFNPPKGNFGRDASSHLLLITLPRSTLSQCLVPFALLDPPPGNLETGKGAVFEPILEGLLVPNDDFAQETCKGHAGMRAGPP